MNLSTDTVSTEPTDVRVPNEMALKCIEATEKAATYCSQLVIRDRTKATLQPSDSVAIEWWVEFARPDRFHVTQAAGEDFDEWITIGSDHYQNVGLWLGGRLEARYDELNHFLLVDKWVGILHTVEPVSAGMYRYREQRYVLLKYNTTNVSGFESLVKSFNKPCQVSIWIDAATGLLAKGEIVVEGQDTDGGQVQLEFQQVFTSYNEKMQINKPESVSSLFASAPITSISSQADLDQFTTYYYQHPNPDLVKEAILFIKTFAFMIPGMR